MENLESKIESILFFKNEPVSASVLSKLLKKEDGEIIKSLEKISQKYKEKESGIVLIKNNDEFSLGTAPENSNIIEELQKEELNKTLSKASLETLSVVLYKNGASRADVDYIRGVNSSFTLRALAMRGLVEKITDPSDNRKYIYKPTTELLSFMGVTRVEELPDFNSISSNVNLEIDNIKEKLEKEEGNDDNSIR
jgi:segregation and condensation protein B